MNSTPFSAGFPIVHPAKSSLAFSVPGPLQKRAHCRLQRTEGRQSRKPRAKQPRAPGRGGSNVEPQEAGTTFPSSWSLSHSSFLGLPETRWEHLHCSSLTVTSRALSMPRGVSWLLPCPCSCGSLSGGTPGPVILPPMPLLHSILISETCPPFSSHFVLCHL